MNDGELVRILEESADPLAVGLSMARLGQFDESAGLKTVLRRFGERWTEASEGRMAEFARTVASRPPADVQAFLERIAPITTSAALRLRAGILAGVGEMEQAAAVLGGMGRQREDGAEFGRQFDRARLLAAAERFAEAIAALRSASALARTYRQAASCERLILGRLSAYIAEQPGKRTARIALLGSTTLDLAATTLRVACFGASIDAQLLVGGFGQYRQEIHARNSPLDTFRPTVVLLVPDWREFAVSGEVANPDAFVDERVAEFRSLWRLCRERFGAFVVHHGFEIPPFDPLGRLGSILPSGWTNVLRRTNAALVEAQREEPGVAFLDTDQVAGLFGKIAWMQPSLWYAAKQHPAPDALCHLAFHQVAVLRALLGLSAKCVVTDLDGTLWGGVIGEDGLSGIRLGGTGEGEAFVAFQRYLRTLRSRGIVITVCSKNNEADARLPFERHPEMVLRMEDIAVFVANWRPKDENIMMIAKALNLGLDSFVFIDDSPTEREWVRSRLPEVTVPELPPDPADYLPAIATAQYFETLDLTAEDRVRADSYRADAGRRVLEAQAASLDEFLAALRLRVAIHRFDDVDLPRIVQLINKTNQFNLTTRRRTAAEISALLAQGNVLTYSLRVSDRFGDSGLTGSMIVFRQADSAYIDTWLMSCRVLGKRLDQVMMCALLRDAARLGLREIRAEYIPTPKNAQVADLYDRLGFEVLRRYPDGRAEYRLEPTPAPPEWPPWVTVEDGFTLHPPAG